MISKASLFNKGIYKSTVKRNIWGSVLYFIILFLFTAMPLISHIDTPDSYMHTAGRPALYRDSFIQTTVIVAIIVASVVAMLVFRFVHSKKTSVFIHSLPVGRPANYISTIAGALTLMAVPVILNGIILLILAYTAYQGNYGVTHCMVWMGLNILCQVIMFSVATFASMITGNTIASVVLTVILHIFPAILISCISRVSSNFLFGYSTDNLLFDSVVESNPAVWITSLASQLGNNSEYADAIISALASKIPFYIIGAAIMYFFSWLLYKKRGMETAEDVAAFGILNPVYKYFITFIGTLGIYTMFNTFFYDSPALFAAIVIVLSAVIYFACEMVLKKTLRVWKSYRGYLAFALCFGVMLGIFAYTSFFGYETRVPEQENVEKVAIYSYYYNETEPFLENPEIIEFAIETHKDMLEKINVKDKEEYETRLHIEYILKNGNKLARTYKLTEKDSYEIMSQLYKNSDYVKANEGIFREEELNRITFTNTGDEITDTTKANELLECVRKDILTMPYNEFRIPYTLFDISLEAAFEVPENNGNPDIPMSQSSIGYAPSMGKIRFVHLLINTNYTNTVNWLKNNGYGHLLDAKLQPPLYIADISNIPDYDPVDQYVKGHKDTITVHDIDSVAAISEFVSENKWYYDENTSYDYAIMSESGRIVTKMNEETYGRVLDIIG